MIGTHPALIFTLPPPPIHSYELEEHTGVCRAMERAAEIFLAAGGVMPEGEEGEGKDDDVGFVGLTGGLGMVGSGWGIGGGSRAAKESTEGEEAKSSAAVAEEVMVPKAEAPGGRESVATSGGGWGIGGGGRAATAVPKPDVV